jgi:hypothetical protein
MWFKSPWEGMEIIPQIKFTAPPSEAVMAPKNYGNSIDKQLIYTMS